MGCALRVQSQSRPCPCSHSLGPIPAMPICIWAMPMGRPRKLLEIELKP